MWEKIKLYYHNSPKRIGLTWLYAHLFFLIVGIFCVQWADFGSIFSFDTLVLAGAMIIFFPLAIFLNLSTSVFRLLIQSSHPIIFLPLYYGWFIAVLYSAKNTQTQFFKIIFILFTLFFIINTISSFCFIFYEFLPSGESF